MNGYAPAAVISCCDSHCPEEVITGELQRNDIAVIRLAAPEDCYRHDADAVASRIVAAAKEVPPGISIGYVGVGAAAAGALIAAAEEPDLVSVVVAVNGRTDLAVDYLRMLRTPVLLIVNDMPVLRMNREALSFLRGERRLEIIHGDGEEAIGQIVQKAVRWISDRLSTPQPSAAA
ncbi:MAG TPA: hypothetical protein VM779_10015 [Thermoanaerobaculia bacterium]|nr:hypothetical protein [Thermoanaerobaculia bacterium]